MQRAEKAELPEAPDAAPPQQLTLDDAVAEVAPPDSLATPDPTLLGSSGKLSVRRAALRAGVSTKTVRRAIERGDLRAFRPGGQTSIVLLEPDVDAWAFRPVVPRPRRARQAPVAVAMQSRRSGAAGTVARLQAIERGEV